MKLTLSAYKKYIPMIAACIALLFGQAMCELALPQYMSDIIDKGIIRGDQSYIYHTGLFMLLVAAGSVIFAVASGAFASITAADSSRDLRSRLFRRVTSYSAAEMEQFSTASLITRSTNDIQNIQQTTVLILRMACFAPCMGIGAIVKAYNTSPGLTWTLGLALAVILILMIVLFMMVMPKFKVLQSKLDRLNLIIGERLSGLLVVRAFNSEKYEEERFEDSNMDLTKINIFVNRCMSFMFPTLMLIMNGTSLLVVWAGAHMIEQGSLMVGDMLAFIQYGMQVIISFLFITMMFIMIPRAAVSARRINEVLSVEPSITDKNDARELDHAAGQQSNDTHKLSNASDQQNAERSKSSEPSQMPAAVRGKVEFNNVSFKYPDADEYSLSGISFTAMPGQTTAVIGGTGSGKSSLIKLIPRFYDVTDGRLAIDDVDVRDILQSSLRDDIGYVPQEGILFSGTIADNLRYGKADADETEMRDAAETAQAADFIDKMPDGFDTEVAQGGTSVSGGQKQRLSIARALIKKPHIYIFDDSFSALDFRTDAVLRAALKKKTGDSTMIIVAQRINTILDADKIVVLDEGRIAGIGTHSELMDSCSVYKEIALSQLSEEELRKEGAK